MKTNKSFSKRVKVTKNGKLVSRKAGHNHFNARASRTKQLEQKRATKFPFPVSGKIKSRFLSN